MARYRKKPVVINAFKLGENYDGPPVELFKWMESFGGFASADDNSDGSVKIITKEGEMQANPGDYIIRGVEGEFYPYNSEIFEKTYENVDWYEAE